MYTLVYDFETSGLNPFHDDVIEIGCKCLETDESFSVLVQPLSNRLICDKITDFSIFKTDFKSDFIPFLIIIFSYLLQTVKHN